MTLAIFLTQLFQGEPLTVAAVWAPVADGGPDEAEVGEVLRARHAEDLEELAGPSLALDEAVAQWAARRVYRVAQAFRLRDVDEAALAEAFAGDPPGPLTPEAVHAVDLSFRYLGDLLDLARGLAPGDALVALGRGLLERWPLSSVGAAGVAVPAGRLAPLRSHAGLRTRYVDRVLAARDYGRLDDPLFQAQAAQALGAYPELAPGWTPPAAQTASS